MSTSPEQLHYLLVQYANNNCTRKELLQLLQAIDEAGHDEALHNSLQSIWQNFSDDDVLPVIDKEKIFSTVIAAAPGQLNRPKKFVWLKVAAAAVFVLALCSLVYLYVNKEKTDEQISTAIITSIKNDKAARMNKAILSLANGSDIVLDSVPNGILAKQGNTTITKVNDRLLVYQTDPSVNEHDVPINYNSLTTPAGTQYEVVLPDGSHVWLNAASAIRYPILFSANERSVMMTGEAYFEVARSNHALTGSGVESSKKIPFVVDILPPAGAPVAPGRQLRAGRIEVLGTHFNIKAYDDDSAIKTTLLEGSVKVSAQTTNYKLLSAGQQASISRKSPGSTATTTGENIVVKTLANANEAIAWKRGELVFNNVTMAEAAQIIERWYNVQVVIKNADIIKCNITVSFLKGESLQQVMDVISAYNDITWKRAKGTIILSGKGCN